MLCDPIRIKICGITRAEDARIAVAAGVDAIGLVFYEPSTRFINPKQASALAKTIPPFVTLVGLFVNHNLHYIKAVHSRVRFSLLQFHGNESPAFCREVSEALSIPFIKAIRVRSTQDIQKAQADYKDAQGLLLDTYAAHQAGGTGAAFDWSLIPQHHELPIILAGGLNSENLTQAIIQVRPYALDVSSGVEQSPGIKSAKKIKAFVAQIHAHCRR